MKIAKLGDVLNINDDPQCSGLLGKLPRRAQPCNEEHLETYKRTQLRFIAYCARGDTRVTQQRRTASTGHTATAEPNRNLRGKHYGKHHRAPAYPAKLGPENVLCNN
jgi:hypothetical protein